MATVGGVLLAVSLIVMAFLCDALGDARKERDTLSEKLSAQQLINTATLSAIAINHRISLDNINAKQAEGTEHVKVKAAIKTVLKDNHCASALVSAGVVSRLQQYERDIRARTGGADTATTDR